MVLVPVDQFLNGAPVSGLGGRADRFLRERGPGATEEKPATDAEIEADGRGLVDDDDAEAVSHVEHFLRVGVVRRPKGVRADPAEKLEVVQHRRIIVATTTDIEILMLAKSLEIERLFIDEEALPLDADGPYAYRQDVAVGELARGVEVDSQPVEVGGARLPENRVGDSKHAVRPAGGRNHTTIRITEFDA